MTLSAHSFVLSLLLLSTSTVSVVLAANSDDVVSACDGAQCTDLTEPDPSELYLLQKKAQVIRKPTMDASLLARDAAKVATKKNSAKTPPHVPLKHRLQHSKTSAFVTAVRSKAVPMTQKQRLAMLSTTEASGLNETWNWLIIAACTSVMIMTAVAIMFVNVIEFKFARVFGDMIQEGIQTVAEDILGLPVTIGSLSVGVLQGKVMITDLKIANPPNCKSESFLNSNTVDVRLNLWSYVWKRFFGQVANVDVDSIAFQDVNLNFEKSATSSNAQEILDLVHGTKDKLAGKEFKAKRSGKGCKLTLHKMTIADAGATVPFWGRVAVPTVHCEDFDKATEGRARTLHPIVLEILQEFCQTGEWAGGVAQGPPEKHASIVGDCQEDEQF